MDKTARERVEENERRFQDAQTKWIEGGRKFDSYYMIIFECLTFAAQNMIKSKLKDVAFSDNVDGMASDLAMLIIERDMIRKERVINRLSSYLYLPMLGIIYNPKRQREDKEMSYEAIMTAIRKEEESEEIDEEEEEFSLKIVKNLT